MTKTIGLPNLNKETGEKRAFLPDFIHFLVDIGFHVTLEENYGSKMGLNAEDYLQIGSLVHMGDRKDVFSKEVVLMLRSPNLDDFSLIGERTCLLSMLHFQTRHERVKYLQKLGINAISMDSIVDTFGRRMIQNFRAVAWNAMNVAFNQFEKRFPGLVRADGKPWQVLIIGTGMVGRHAVDAASKFGDRGFNKCHMQNGGSGVVVRVVGRNITSNKGIMRKLFLNTDMLIDATKRKDASNAIIPNILLDYLPEDSLIVDLTADPYILTSDPPLVKGIEGIPTGNLDRYIYEMSEDWDKYVPSEIPSTIRRKTISCYSWPGIYPRKCMQHYAEQLKPFMNVLGKKTYSGLSNRGDLYERALYGAKIDTFIQTQ